MPSLKDLLDAIREFSVSPSEVKVSRKLYSDLTQKAAEMAEEDEEEED